MASIENLLGPSELLTHLRAMDEGELLGQQCTQQGAIHVISFLLVNGCTEALAIELLASLKQNMETVCQVAEEKGFKRLFGGSTPNFN